MEIVERKKPHFRIQIYDLINKKTKNITITNSNDVSIEKLREYLVECLKRFSKTENYLKKGNVK